MVVKAGWTARGRLGHSASGSHQGRPRRCVGHGSSRLTDDVFRALAAFGLVVIVASLGSIMVGGALLAVPIRFSRFLDDAFGLPAIKQGARLAPIIVRLVGLALIGCGCLIAWNAYRAS